MSIIELFLIAIALSMDTLAVSISIGLCKKYKSIFCYILPGLYFSVFQSLMPLLGFKIGSFFASTIQAYDHWITFGLLSIIGIKMIKDSRNKSIDCEKDDFCHISLSFLALATSIDALAVGITFSFFNVNIIMAMLIIGITTFIFSVIGIKIGFLCGAKYRSKAEIFGGIVLVLIGVKILLEHL